jgi:hypothetical protein
MKLTGHKTEAIYRRYAIVSESDLAEGVKKLATLHQEGATARVVGLEKARQARTATKPPQFSTVANPAGINESS